MACPVHSFREYGPHRVREQESKQWTYRPVGAPRNLPPTWDSGKGKGNLLWRNEHRINCTQVWVKEVGQTGTMATHNTPSGQKCCDNHLPFKSTVHKGYNVPCSMIVIQIACREARRRIRVPSGTHMQVSLAQGLASKTCT